MGQPAARVGDMHTCPMVTPGLPPIPHVGGPVLPPGVINVLIGGMPAATVGSMCLCVGPPDVIVRGSFTVLIGGRPAARMGDNTAHGGIITMGCPTVLIGDVGMGGASAFAAGIIGFLDMARQQLANSALNWIDRLQLQAAITQYEQTQHTLAMAVLSQNVYGENPRLPPGYEPVSPEDLKRLKIDPKMLQDDKSGFKAAIYRNNNAKPGEPAYVIAYAGTEGLGKDAIADAVQGVGLESAQYTKARDLAVAMDIATHDQGGFETTGHSLGGGLAAAGSAVTGAPGTTFNAAGLHRNTTARWGLDPGERERNAANVDAYYNSDDPLNMAQNNRGKVLASTAPLIGIGNAAGLYVSGALPPAYGNQHEIPSEAGILNGHQIGSVISNLEQQQAASQSVIQRNAQFQ